MEPQDFINWIGPVSSIACSKYNILASVQIAQAILESGWGRSRIGEYNLFGMKYAYGEPIEINGVNWQKYNSLEEACEHQAYTIARPDGYYAQAVALLPDKIAYIRAMAEIYAPSSDGNVNYADKVIGLCDEFNLWAWDDPAMAQKIYDEFAQKVIKAAEEQLNLPFSDGADGVKATDAGLFVQTALSKVGIMLPSSKPSDIYNYCVEKKVVFTEVENAKPGYLVFFQMVNAGSTPGVVDHVGIVTGDNKMIHASRLAGKVCYDDYGAEIWRTRRVGFAKVEPGGPLFPRKEFTAASQYDRSNASDNGFKTETSACGRKKRVKVRKLPLNKTFAEPVYPDLVTVTDTLPPWLLEKANIPPEKMTLGDMLVYTIPDDVLREACGAELDTIIGSRKAIEERQKLFDPTKYKDETKPVNPGKPANNNDPFPVDLKIEELELHQPRVKVHAISMCDPKGPDVQLAKEIIGVSDRTEKRLARIENNLATIMRYLYRLSARVHINCVYYGGQSIYQKYCAIRCLHHDRTEDGQLVQIDQCLNCTRYEPIIGQVYDIVDETGTNLAAILDDNQMAYATMQDYIDFVRVERYHDELPKAKFSLENLNVRDTVDKDFKDIWPEGFKMKWKYVPVEEQKPLINWRQSVNNDGSKMQKLDSYQYSQQNSGANIVIKPSAYAIMKQNYENMRQSTSADLQQYIDYASSSYESYVDEAINMLRGGLDKEIRAKVRGTDVDPAIVAAMMAAEKKYDDIDKIIDGYVAGIKAVGSNNPLFGVMSYKSDPIVFVGQEPNVKRIDKATLLGVVLPTLVWEVRDKWLWTEIVPNFKVNLGYAIPSANVLETIGFFPLVTYIYMQLVSQFKTSRYDGDKFAFPFFDEQLNNVWFTSDFGPRPHIGNGYHYGIDLATGRPGDEIHAIESGTVVWVGDYEAPDCNGIAIDHGDGWYSRYFHNSERYVTVGQVVNKGDVIARVGDAGSPGAYHLHVEIAYGAPDSSHAQDPKLHWPLLNGKLGDGDVPPLGQLA